MSDTAPAEQQQQQTYALDLKIGLVPIAGKTYVGMETKIGPLGQSVVVDVDSAEQIGQQWLDAAAEARRANLGLTIATTLPPAPRG